MRFERLGQIWLIVALVALARASADQSAFELGDDLRQQQSGLSSAKTPAELALELGPSNVFQEAEVATDSHVSAQPDANLRPDAEQQEIKNQQQQQQLEEEPLNQAQGAGYLCRLRGLIGRCSSEASKFVADFIRPKREYLALVQRYRRWYWAYSALFEATKDQDGQSDYLAPSDLLALEFARVDRELYAELMAKRQSEDLENRAEQEQQEQADVETVKTTIKTPSEPIESTDFLFEALRRLIDRLEPILALAQDGELPARPLIQNNEDDQQQGRLSVADLKATQEFRDSMERLKRIASQTARGFVKGELIQVGKIAALNALATHLAESPPTPGSSLSYLAPLVAFMGTANASLLASYLTNVEMRAAMRAVDGLNPVPKVVNGLVERLSQG